MNARSTRNVFVYLLILVALVLVVVMVFRPATASSEKPISEVISLAQQGKVESIEVNTDNLLVKIKDQAEPIRSRKEESASVQEILKDANVTVGGDKGVRVVVKGPSQFGNVVGLLINFLPIIAFGAILIFMMRQAGGANNQATSMNVTVGFWPVNIFARLLPKDIAWLLVPWACRIM